jgi:hypothetical protein
MADMGENILEISGEINQLSRFREMADETIIPLSKRDPYNGEHWPSVLSFHRLYPIPGDVTAIGYHLPGGAYDWQKTYWGVKWGATDAAVDGGRDWLRYVFDTAWEPPVAWLAKVSADYPLLTFELSFRDPNSNWVDEFIFYAGQCIEDHEKIEDYRDRKNPAQIL